MIDDYLLCGFVYFVAERGLDGPGEPSYVERSNLHLKGRGIQSLGEIGYGALIGRGLL